MLKKVLTGWRNRRYVKEAMREVNLDIKKDEFKTMIESASRLTDLKEYNEAIKMYKQLVKSKKILSPEEEKQIYTDYADSLAKSGNSKEAIVLMNEVLSKNPEDVVILKKSVLILLLVCNRHQKLSELLTNWKDARRETRKHDYHQMEKWDAARAVSRHFEDELSNNKSYLSQADIILQKLLKQKIENKIEYVYYMGIVMYLRDKINEAVACFDLVLDIDEKYTNSLYPTPFFETVRKERAEYELENNSIEYHNKYKTDSGNVVRSKIEALIDNFYHHKNISFEYEPTLILDQHTIRPDWCLTFNNKQYYHEHVGNEASLKRVEWKSKLYKKHNISFFCTYWHEEENITEILSQKINQLNHE